MTIKLRIEPRWGSEGVPFCDVRCVSHDGKRCAVMGYRPGPICEPTVRGMSVELRRYRAIPGLMKLAEQIASLDWPGLVESQS